MRSLTVYMCVDVLSHAYIITLVSRECRHATPPRRVFQLGAAPVSSKIDRSLITYKRAAVGAQMNIIKSRISIAGENFGAGKGKMSEKTSIIYKNARFAYN